jgi:hypothetical protein
MRIAAKRKALYSIVAPVGNGSTVGEFRKEQAHKEGYTCMFACIQAAPKQIQLVW